MFASTNSPNSFTSPNSATSATSATSAVSTKPAPAPTLVTHINAIIQKKALEHVGVRPEDIREALYAFIELLNLHTELPGAILISLYGGVFKDPASANGQKSTFRQCINSVLSTLSKPGLAGPIFFSKEKDSMTRPSSQPAPKRPARTWGTRGGPRRPFGGVGGRGGGSKTERFRSFCIPPNGRRGPPRVPQVPAGQILNLTSYLGALALCGVTFPSTQPQHTALARVCGLRLAANCPTQANSPSANARSAPWT